MIALALLPLCAALAAAEEPSTVVISRLQDETAARIQSRLLDPLLGPGKSSAFVRFAVRSRRSGESSERKGVGFAEHARAKNLVDRSSDTVSAQSLMPEQNLFRDFGFFANDTDSVSARSGDAMQSARPGTFADKLAAANVSRGSREEQAQAARQEKLVDESTATISMTFVDFKVVVIHDISVPQRRLDAVRQALIAVYAPDLNPTDLRFEPLSFARARAP